MTMTEITLCSFSSIRKADPFPGQPGGFNIIAVALDIKLGAIQLH